VSRQYLYPDNPSLPVEISLSLNNFSKVSGLWKSYISPAPHNIKIRELPALSIPTTSLNNTQQNAKKQLIGKSVVNVIFCFYLWRRKLIKSNDI